MAKGDVGSQKYAPQAMGSVPQFGQAVGGGLGPGMMPGGGGMMGPSFPNMLIQMAMRNQMQQPQMQYQGFPGQQMGGSKGSMGGNQFNPGQAQVIAAPDVLAKMRMPQRPGGMMGTGGGPDYWRQKYGYDVMGSGGGGAGTGGRLAVEPRGKYDEVQ